MFTLLSTFMFTPLGHPRLYFAVNYRSGIMRPATVSREQGEGTLVGQADGPPPDNKEAS
jgi:hypothetical protein